jgi:hypothetical protein
MKAFISSPIKETILMWITKTAKSENFKIPLQTFISKNIVLSYFVLEIKHVNANYLKK